MANVQIPNLPAAIAVSGAEQLEAVQAGTSVRVTAAQIASLASSGSAGVVANIAATGTTGATSAPLTGVINAVTSATTGVAVGIYITAGVGINQTVFNATAVDLVVYPSNNGTGQIDNLSVGASIPLAAYTSKTFTKDNSGVFRTVANGLINSTLIGYEKPNYIIMKGVTATGSSTVAETRMEVTGTDTNVGMLFAAKGDGWFRARRLVAQATSLTPTSGALPAVQMGIVNSLSGTITTGTASAFSWQIAGDTASATGATGGNIYYMNGLNEFGGTGMTGGRIGLNVSHVLNRGDTSNNPSGNYFHTGIQSQTTASFRDGGVYGDPSGELFAFFGSSELRPAARHWNHVKAAEYNISIDRYGSASFKSGITIGNSTTDGEESIIEESFLAIGAKKANASSSTGLRTGILYGGAGGFWGIPPYGSLIEAAPTTVTGFGPAPAMSAAYGIDWSLVSFLGASWRMADVTIDGAGNIGTNTVNAGLTLQTLNGVTAKSASVASYTVLAGGIFTGRPTFTVAASPGGGTTATGNVATMGMKLITGITAAGSGYAVGELLTPTSGTGTQASIRVVAVDGSGGVTYAVINRVSEVEQVGSYTATALPSSPFATTSSGSGTGAQFTANYTILTCAVGTGGTLYPQFPAPQVSIDTSLLIRRAKIIPVMTATTIPINLLGTTTVSGLFRRSSATGLTATGTTQGTALLLAADYNEVSTVAAGSGVVMPATSSGASITVWNRGANALKVYPPSGGAINGLSANAPFVIMAGYSNTFEATSSTQFRIVNNNLGATNAGTFSPLDYGAVGDGTTDDTAAVQAAYDAVGTNGGTVILPRGYSFALSATIIVKSKTITLGGGRLVGRASASWPSGQFWCFKNTNFDATSITDVDLMFFGIEVDWSAVSASGTSHLFHFRMARNVVVSECKGINAASATAFLACDDTVVEKCRFTGFYNCGIDHWENPKNAVVTENYLETTVSAQMVNFNPDPTTGSSVGYIADGFTMSNNVLVSTENPSTPCQIEPLAPGSIVRNVTISGNVFKGSYLAIRGDIRGASVVGNTFSDLLGDVEAVISYLNWSGTPSAITVSDNVIRDPVTASPNLGVIRVECDSGIIADNQIMGTAYSVAAIYRGTTNCQIWGNYVERTAARHPGFLQDGGGSIPGQFSAAGIAVGTSTVITTQLAAVTSATAGVNDGVQLANYVGFPQTITNTTAVSINVYPRNLAGSSIDGGASLAPVTLAAGRSKTFVAYSAGAYRTIGEF